MKKNIIILLLLCCLFISGCNNTKNIKGSNNTNTSTQDGAVYGKINGEPIRLNYERNFKDLYYKENISDMDSSTLGALRIITYRKDGQTLLELRMAYTESTSLAEAEKKLTYTAEHKTINGIEFLYGSAPVQFDSGETINSHQYFCEYNKTLYGITLISNEDISDFEQAFINTIHF